MPCLSVVHCAHHYFGQDDGTFTEFISSDDRQDKWIATVTVKMILLVR